MSRLFRDADGPVLAPRGTVVCIGAFDGVHRGHQALLEHVRTRALALGIEAAAVSFEPVPRQYFQGRDAIARLSSPRQKARALLARVDLAGLLRFNARTAAMDASEFVARTLVGRLAAREVWVGEGFRFGHARRGDIALLRVLGADAGFAANELEPVVEDGGRISSSRIRAALAADDFAGAASMLGRAFAMEGHVLRGRQLGRRLGFPTANLGIRYGRAPVHGIFAVRVSGAGLTDWPAVASLGTRPTVHGVEPLLEAHLFDFDADLYGRVLEVTFLAKLRDEIKFHSLDALVLQMREDAQRAREILNCNSTVSPT